MYKRSMRTLFNAGYCCCCCCISGGGSGGGGGTTTTFWAQAISLMRADVQASYF